MVRLLGPPFPCQVRKWIGIIEDVLAKGSLKSGLAAKLAGKCRGMPEELRGGADRRGTLAARARVEPRYEAVRAVRSGMV